MERRISIGDLPKLPSAHIAINKGRLKCYNSQLLPTYYLKNGSEFQIEFFNPTNSTIKAVISLNGDKISNSGIVLKPGERIFLERYLDSPKKFHFSTYEVDSGDGEVDLAIKENGLLEVSFYKEKVIKQNYIYNSINHQNSSLELRSKSSNLMRYTRDLMEDTRDLMDGILVFNSLSNPNVNLSYHKKETGRVEEGDYSEQSIKRVIMEFEKLPFHTIKSKLLPESIKPKNTEDLIVKSYCTQCGAKQKKDYKFCPKCGMRN